MEVEFNPIVSNLLKNSNVEGVKATNAAQITKDIEEQRAIKKKGTHGTLIENVMRTTAAVYEGSWIQAQREVLSGRGKLPE